MAFLSNLASSLIQWILTKIGSWIVKIIKIKKKYGEARKKNKKIKEQTQKAQTKKERRDALKRDADNF